LRAKLRIEKIFKVFDKDEDGFISHKEFKTLLANVSGCEPPAELCDMMVKDNPQKLISLPRTIFWFESQNPIDRGSRFKSNPKISFSSSSKV